VVKLKRPALHPGADIKERVYTATFIAVAWIVVLGALPILAVMGVGFLQGSISENLISPASGYPAFTTLSPGLIVPAVLVAWAFARTFTWPLRAADNVQRGELVWIALLGMNVAIAAVTLDRALIPVWAGRLSVGAALLFLLVAPLSLVRMLAGWLHLVPRSWRVEPEKPKRRRRS